MALKKGVTVLNTPGSIDADYRGDIGVIRINTSNEPVTIENGEGTCQTIVSQYSNVEWSEEEVLGDTERGAGGFGHTGVK